MHTHVYDADELDAAPEVPAAAVEPSKSTKLSRSGFPWWAFAIGGMLVLADLAMHGKL